MARMFMVALGLLLVACHLCMLLRQRNIGKLWFQICSKVRRRRETSSPNLPLPPGPPGLPIIGNLFQLGSDPHRALAKLNRKYGPIVYLRLGVRPTLATCSPHIAKEILKTQDHVFASRAPTVAAEYFAYEFNDIAMAPYGPAWRNARRICVSELLTPRRLELFATSRREEADIMVQRIWENYLAGEVTDLQITLGSFAMNIITRMLFSKSYCQSNPITETRCQESDILKMLHKSFQLMGATNISDYLPYLRRFDLQGYEKQMRAIRRQVDYMYDGIIEERRQFQKQHPGSQPKDFVDLLLASTNGRQEEERAPLSNTAVKGILHDMIAAGTDTSSVSSEYVMAELLLNPNILKKVQSEIDDKVGTHRLVDESDVMNLQYLRCVVKEAQRLHPSGPFVVPRLSMVATQVAGYHIPKGTTVLVNLFGLGRNPDVWDNPEQFDPERFAAGGSPDLKDPEFRIAVFGGGRRGCPGATLGTLVVLLGVARLIQCFDWACPPGAKVDLTEVYGMTCPLKHHLVAMGTPRLPHHLYAHLATGLKDARIGPAPM